MHDPVTAWAHEVVSGQIVAGPHIRNAAKRHLRDVEHGPSRGLQWDVETAVKFIDLFPKHFRLKDGKFQGKPFTLHPSQAFRVGSLFGWKKADGRRRFRRFYDEEGKGNGKSPLLAGLGLIGLVFDGENGAEVYAAASKRDQAMVLFKDAVSMVQQSGKLSDRITCSGVNPVWGLTYRSKAGDERIFKPLSSDKAQSGPRPHFALCDEVHEHPTRDIIDMLERGFKFREQPLLVMATNSGVDRKGVCYSEHTHAIRVAAGEVEDDDTFAFVCSLDEGDDWLNDPSCWIKANPLLGTILTEEYLAGVVKQARDIPGKRNGIARLHFCEWTEGETVWIAPEVWAAAEDPELSLDDLIGRKCWDSLDIGLVSDMTARAKVFEDGVNHEGKPKYILWAHGYTPKDTLIQRSEADQAPYDVWVEQGHLTATPGRLVRLDHVATDICNETLIYNSQGLAYDNWNYQKFQEEIDLVGMPLPVFRHPQGINHAKETTLYMPDSIDAIERLIMEDRLRIFVNPALRAAVMSVAFWESPTSLRMFMKKKATARIDLAVAATMAVGFANNTETIEGPSVYETRGLLSL